MNPITFAERFLTPAVCDFQNTDYARNQDLLRDPKPGIAARSVRAEYRAQLQRRVLGTAIAHSIDVPTACAAPRRI